MKKIMYKISEEEQILNMYNRNKISQKRGILTEIHIADIHFDCNIQPSIHYKILEEQFLNKLEYINFDIVSVDGDLFNHKVMAESDAAMYAIMFIDRLVDLCRRKNATLIIIHGTLLHDSNQLKLFYHYLKDNSIDIRIVERVRFEYVKGARILCIPELYNMGEEYYTKFLYESGEYDSVFMHGTIKGAIYGKNKEDLKTDKAPVFSIDNFCFCRGPIISGHVHVSACFDKYFYYCGSPIRYKFGEEQEKGFLIVLHNLDTQQHYVHLEPIESFRYDTVSLDDLIRQDPKNIIDYIQVLKDEGIDKIRITFNKKLELEEEANLNIIRNYYNKDNSVDIDYKTQKIEIKQDSDIINDKYSFLLDKELNDFEIFIKYVNMQEGEKFITISELEDMLNDDII